MKRVLVIDDDPSISELIADFCISVGYEAKTLNDSTQAVAVAKEWGPDLVTLDLEMPGSDGIEVLKNLHGNPDTKHIPVIVVSIVADKAEKDGLLKDAQGVFSKPIKFPTFLSRLEVLLKPQP